MATPHVSNGVRKGWQALGLARQFLLISAVVILTGMLLIGHWLSYRIEEGVTQNTALATALYVESFVSPRIQSLADGDTFRPEVQRELERVMRETALGQRVLSFKVWNRDGRIIYASRTQLIGETFPPTRNLREAWSGRVAAEFDQLNDQEDALEREVGHSLLEIYVPIRKALTDDIIAAVEFYEDADKLKKDIFRAKLESWLILSVVGLLAVLVLYGTIAGASRVIESQRRTLEERVSELSGLLDQNQSLRRRLERASLRSAEINERYLRQLGSELHDGPAQLVSLALLRLDASKRTAPASARETTGTMPADDKATVRSALSDALHEIRNLSVGLSLPEIERLTIGEAIKVAVGGHERRTGMKVDLTIKFLPASSPHVIKATCFRVVQEGLNNAAKHGKGAGQKVVARSAHDEILIEVHDAGPGFDPAIIEHTSRLGLVGLRERLESMGGALVVKSEIGRGTSLLARLPSNSGRLADV